MAANIGQGMTPMKSMLNIIQAYMQKQSPAASKGFTSAMAIQNDAERQKALEKLSQTYKLGELFSDQQSLNFIRAALQNQQKLNEIRNTSLADAGNDVTGKSFKKMMESPVEQFKSLQVSLGEMSIEMGNALLPAVIEVLQAIRPMVLEFGVWVKAHPGAITGFVKVAGSLLAMKLGFIGLRLGINAVLTPFNALHTTFNLVAARWTLLKALWVIGGSAVRFSLLGMVKTLLESFRIVGSFIIPFGRGFFMAFGAPLALLGRGLLTVSRLLAGSLVRGVMLAGQAVLWLGRALMLNPIGLVITAIAAGAYLIYTNWDKIKPLFDSVVNSVSHGMEWLVEKTTGIVTWLGDLPSRFVALGGEIINGLVTGVSNKLTAAKESIVGFGGSIRDWFAETLGIHSPSRVFMSFGDNIATGAALGIHRGSDQAIRVSEDMARRVAETATSNRVLARQSLGGGTGAGGGIHITFNPTIQMSAPAGGSVEDQVNRALALSQREFEKLMTRYLADRDRRAYS